MTARHAFAGLHVLVVEDEVLCAMMIADVLGDLGCEVVGPAATPREALRLIDTLRVDIAMLDLHLARGETTYPVADALLARQVPFAFLTGLDAPALPAPYGGWPFFRKPFRVDHLDAVIRELAGRRQAA